MDPIIGTIIIFAGTFAPKGWAFCNGQIISLFQNQALFSLIGTTYGGDGLTTFALPDLRGRAPVSAGQGPGLSNYTLGEKTGTETVTLNVAQMPQHNHLVNANNSTTGSIEQPNQAYLSQSADNIGKAGVRSYAGSLASPSTLNLNAVQYAGNSQAHSNIQPVLAINYIIALQGIFPSRD